MSSSKQHWQKFFTNPSFCHANVGMVEVNDNIKLLLRIPSAQDSWPAACQATFCYISLCFQILTHKHFTSSALLLPLLPFESLGCLTAALTKKLSFSGFFSQSKVFPFPHTITFSKRNKVSFCVKERIISMCFGNNNSHEQKIEELAPLKGEEIFVLWLTEGDRFVSGE